MLDLFCAALKLALWYENALTHALIRVIDLTFTHIALIYTGIVVSYFRLILLRHGTVLFNFHAIAK